MVWRSERRHAAINARWIADPEVAFVQVGDIFDRADHSELAAEILRQLIIDAPWTCLCSCRKSRAIHAGKRLPELGSQ